MKLWSEEEAEVMEPRPYIDSSLKELSVLLVQCSKH